MDRTLEEINKGVVRENKNVLTSYLSNHRTRYWTLYEEVEEVVEEIIICVVEEHTIVGGSKLNRERTCGLR